MNYAIILSGGIGTRMHMGDFPKQYYKIHEGKSHEFLMSMRGTTEIAHVAGMKICGNEDLHDPRGSHEFQDHASRGPAEIQDDRGGVTLA